MVSSSSKLLGNMAYNVVCIYNGQRVCLYLNGALQVGQAGISVTTNADVSPWCSPVQT
jgi:hypothetical protein